jgi:general secretion pathway protein N
VRVDSAGPRTWLLATLAGWALLVWVLALLGMGGNITPLADDPSLVQRLPSPPTPPPERIGTLAQYGEAGARPLLSEDRRPQPFSLQPEGEVAPAPSFDFILTSVLRAPGLQMAIVQPSAGGESIRMRLGEAPDEAQGWRLVELHPRSAIFEGPEGQKTLDLRTFDGVGGEAPTAMAAPQAADMPARPGVARATDASAPMPAASVPRPLPPGTPPKPVTAPTPTPTTAAASPPGATPLTPEAQMEAIRKRIEARRAQLRAQAQQEQPPAKKP